MLFNIATAPMGRPVLVWAKGYKQPIPAIQLPGQRQSWRVLVPTLRDEPSGFVTELVARDPLTHPREPTVWWPFPEVPD